MSQGCFCRPYGGMPLRSTYPSRDHGNLQTTFATVGNRKPAPVISEVPNGGNRIWTHQNTPLLAHLEPVAAGVEPNKSSAAAGVAQPQHTVTDASGPTSSSLGEDGTFNSSGSVPDRIPEDEIEHKFVHRHSLPRTHTKDDTSQRTDRALRDVGRERELPTDNHHGWSRCRKAVSRIRPVAATTIIFIVIFVALARGFRSSDLNSGGGAHAAAAPAEHDTSGASHNYFLMPVPSDNSASDLQRPEKTTAAKGSKKQDDGNEHGPDEIMRDAVEGADAKAGGEEAAPVGENA